MDPNAREYSNEDIVVYWFPDLCSKSGKCTSLLPKVFEEDRRPWIDISQAEARDIILTIDQCPSGALKYSFPQKLSKRSLTRGKEEVGVGHIDYEEKTLPLVTLRTVKNGPLITNGIIAVYDTQGTFIKKGAKLAFCRCGLTKNQPFCDATHIKKGWKEPE